MYIYISTYVYIYIYMCVCVCVSVGVPLKHIHDIFVPKPWESLSGLGCFKLGW